jgi:hypothetical protein
MSFYQLVQSRRLIVLGIALLLCLAIPFSTALAQDPETSSQERNDELVVATVLILLVGVYAAIFVGEDADSRGKDGVQWGIAFFIIVCAAPLVYYFLAEGDGDNRLSIGGGIFLAVLNIALGVYYRILRPRQFKFS